MPKKDDTICILFQNVNGIGTDVTSHIAQHKLGELKKLVIQHKVDIIGMAECNIDWRTLTDSLAGFPTKKRSVRIIKKLVQPYQSPFSQEEQQQSQQIAQWTE